jgi:hypothetical protein
MRTLRERYAAQSLRGQLLTGCLGIATLAICALYGLGLGSVLVRPYLFASQAGAGATIIPRVTSTLAPTPTQLPEVTIALPGSTLVATPTQAPIPTRAPSPTPTSGEIPTITPIVEITEPVQATDTVPPTQPPTVRPTKTKVPTIQPPAQTATPKATKTRKPTVTQSP